MEKYTSKKRKGVVPAWNIFKDGKLVGVVLQIWTTGKVRGGNYTVVVGSTEKEWESRSNRFQVDPGKNAKPVDIFKQGVMEAAAKGNKFSIKEYIESRGGLHMLSEEEKKTIIESYYLPTMPREFYCRADAKPIKDTKSDAVVHICEEMRDGKMRYYATGFHGKAKKPDFNYFYNSDAQRGKKIEEFFKSRRALAKDKMRRSAERKAEDRGLEIDDVLLSSWGYDQTNIDYYQVVGMVGKTTVVLRELAQRKKETGFMSGTTMPIKNKFVGPAFKKQAKKGSVKINSHQWAFKTNPKESSYWSSYA